MTPWDVRVAIAHAGGISGEDCFMFSNNIQGSRAAPAWGFMALFAMLAMGLALMASPAAAPFAYVTNESDNTVSVIDMATNKVVATVPVGSNPYGVAVTPDGKHAYVANDSSNTVSVIDRATNTVEATITVGTEPVGAAVTPDGNVANIASHTVSVIDTATVVATVPLPVASNPVALAVTPDGKHVYVTNDVSVGTVSVIDTATNTVEAATITVGTSPTIAIAVTPDGLHAYVVNNIDRGSGTVSVIDTATNPPSVVATILAGWSSPLRSPPPRMGNTPIWRTLAPTLSRRSTRAPTLWGPRSRWGPLPLGWPSRWIGNTSMSRIITPTMFR
jgi:YVTN family beta-propeller protein